MSLLVEIQLPPSAGHVCDLEGGQLTFYETAKKEKYLPGLLAPTILGHLQTFFILG